MRIWTTTRTTIIALTLAFVAVAGDTDSPAAPNLPVSAMYHLEDIYNRLDTGAAGAKRAGAFEEPTAGDFAAGAPGDSGPTLDDVMGAAPAANGNAATAGDVLSGKVFWGLDAGAWGQQTGTVPAGNALTGADGSLTITITNGLYTGLETATAQDSDLTSGNIRSGANIFGVAGDSNVVNTSSGDATAGDIATGKKAWVDGAEITGTASGGSGAAVEKTGQTTSYATGDDGDLETGVVWPSPRFTDNSDGTVTDNLTGLIWLQDADAGDGTETWANALSICNSLATGQQGLSDGSSAGDWRLPTDERTAQLDRRRERRSGVAHGAPVQRRAVVELLVQYYVRGLYRLRVDVDVRLRHVVADRQVQHALCVAGPRRRMMIRPFDPLNASTLWGSRGLAPWSREAPDF